MEIYLNGEPCQIADDINAAQLIEELALAVEVDFDPNLAALGPMTTPYIARWRRFTSPAFRAQPPRTDLIGRRVSGIVNPAARLGTQTVRDDCLTNAQGSVGAGEGNRTLVISLGS